MQNQPDRSIVIRLSLDQVDPAQFLQGLEDWLRLGLLSDEQVRQLGQQYLSCALPPAIAPATSGDANPNQRELVAAGGHTAAECAADDFADAGSAPVSSPVSSSAPTSRLGRSLQALMAEISVIWLLFLGVFLVVVSSGVLAASQWQQVSPVGQYAILLGYTLAFFGVGRWAGRRSNLRWTARMLQIATLLIVPVNFWVIDGLLGQSGQGTAVGAIAGLLLSGITLWLLRPGSELLQGSPSRLTALNSLALSGLQLGWGGSAVPLLAAYAGTIGTAGLTVWQDRSRSLSEFRPRFSPATLTIALSMLLLIGRAVFVAQVPFRQLGLALGIGGWLFCWLWRDAPSRNLNQAVWTGLGSLLLLLGWAVTIAVEPPWQAVGVSGLTLWLLIDRLYRTGRSSLLLLLFGVGLQAYCSLWWLVPQGLRQTVIASASQLLGNAAMPDALLGLAGFPYLWLTLAVASWLRRSPDRWSAAANERPVAEPIASSHLAQQTERLAFGLGLVLLLLSLLNPGVRSVSLWLSAATLGLTSRSSPARIYLTHSAGLTAVLSSLDGWWPSLTSLQWGSILLGLMTIEWGCSLGRRYPLWQQSAWLLGLGLAGLSYAVLLPTDGNPTLIWPLVPLLLTGLSRLSRFAQPRLAAWLSTIALCAALLLVNSLNAAILASALGVGLLLLNTHSLRHLVPAVLTLGFGLGLEVTLVEKWTNLTPDTVLLLLAAVLWQLWGWRHGLRRLSHPVAQLYASAAEGWAIGLAGIGLLWLTGLSAVVLTTQAASGQQQLGVALVLGAIAYRLWQQPTNLGFWALAWAVEIAVAIAVGLSGGDSLRLGAANLGLELGAQALGDVWVSRSRQPYWASWHGIPLLYAGLGLWLGHTDYTALTGLYTLSAAWISVWVGRRSSPLHLLTLLGLVGLSIAAYEGLIYQLLQAEGSAGDGWALLAGLALLVSWSYHGLADWLRRLHLSDRQRHFLAHTHWAIGSGLAAAALLFDLSAVGTGILIGTALLLSGYALTMANRRWRQRWLRTSEPDTTTSHRAAVSTLPSELWTYAGLLELLATIGYGLYEVVPNTSGLLSWAGAIASGISVGLYHLPWNRGGWSERPARRLAIGLPLLTVIGTATMVALQSLVLAAAVYAWLAKALTRIRISYLSIVLFDWALLRFLHQQGWLTTLWLGAVLSGLLLYAAQIDPLLQPQSARSQRHWLRSLAIGLISLTAFYQAEVETGATAIVVGGLTLAGSMLAIAIGLLRRVRAFLYLGTVTFVLRILRWLWLFLNTDALLLWSVGIVLGMIFIWIAATFEARRSQVSAVVQYWSSELETWE
jgi:hypothetical protein